MTTNVFQTEKSRSSERKELDFMVGAGTSAEALVGLGTAILALLGLFGVLRMQMTAIAAIAAGCALLIEGLSIGRARAKVARDARLRAGSDEKMHVSGDFTTEAFGGVAAIVLGILGLIGVLPTVLLSAAVMALGAALLAGGPARAELDWTALEIEGGNEHARYLAARAVRGAAGVFLLVGVISLVLGVLALVQTGTPFVYTLVALLMIGISELMSGSALLGRLATGLRH